MDRPLRVLGIFVFQTALFVIILPAMAVLLAMYGESSFDQGPLSYFFKGYLTLFPSIGQVGLSIGIGFGIVIGAFHPINSEWMNSTAQRLILGAVVGLVACVVSLHWVTSVGVSAELDRLLLLDSPIIGALAMLPPFYALSSAAEASCRNEKVELSLTGAELDS